MGWATAPLGRDKDTTEQEQVDCSRYRELIWGVRTSSIQRRRESKKLDVYTLKLLTPYSRSPFVVLKTSVGLHGVFDWQTAKVR